VSLSDALMERTEHLTTLFGTLNIFLKIVFVLAAGVPFIAFFGLLYHKISDLPLPQSLLKFYLLINRLPGMSVLNETSLPAALLVNSVYYLGAFSFAIFLGVVTQEVEMRSFEAEPAKAYSHSLTLSLSHYHSLTLSHSLTLTHSLTHPQVKETYANIRSGAYQVQEQDHLVILNWNHHTPLVLKTIAQGREMALARKDSGMSFYSKHITILADKPKAEMDKLVQATGVRPMLEVHTRRGNPSHAKDLRMISAGKASIVLVMQPEMCSKGVPDSSTHCQAHIGAVAMAVSTLTAGPRMVVQTPVLHASEGKVPKGYLMGSLRACVPTLTANGGVLQVLDLSEKDFTERFLSLTALQPGLVKFYELLMQPGPPGVSTHLPPTFRPPSTHLPPTFRPPSLCSDRRRAAARRVCGAHVPERAAHVRELHHVRIHPR
jgi:hypothetical protein